MDMQVSREEYVYHIQKPLNYFGFFFKYLNLDYLCGFFFVTNNELKQ